MSSKKQKRILEDYAVKQEKLKKDVSALKGQLTKTEQKLTKAAERTERWKKEAKAHKKSASKAGGRVELLQEQLDQASAALETVPSEAIVEAAGVDGSVSRQDTDEGVGAPNESWTVVQLRAEARARGMAGMSKKSKADLIAALA